MCLFFFFNDTATTEIYTLSLHDALPISQASSCVSFAKSKSSGSARRRTRSPRHEILPRQLDANVARRRDHVRLHVLARGPSSRSDFDAGPPARLPHPSFIKLPASGNGRTLVTSRP